MSKKKDIGKVFTDTFTVIKQGNNLKIFIISTVFFALLYLLFYGVYTIPILEIGFFKMTPFSLIDGLYVATASILTGLIITLFKHNKSKSGKGLLGGGVFASGFGIFCPACLGANLLIFGNVIALPLASIVPFLWLIQLTSLLFLFFGFWFSAKSVDCASCVIHSKKPEKSALDMNFSKYHKYILGLLSIIMVALLAIQLVPLNGSVFTITSNSGGTNINEITNQVLPEEGFTINARWGDVVKKMIDERVLDPVKLENILVNRYGQQMKPEWRDILNGKDTNLEINADNSVFMMYMLWLIAKHNDNPIIHNSPFASSFGPNYDIGAGRPGYGDTKLLTLTPEQQTIATKVAENSYRPCCGQSAARPDCSHGYSALGLMQLMASQGFSEEEIFDAFVKFNSYWFPANYIQTALYFKITENQDWDQVDKELVAGQQFSSLSGSYQVKKVLQDAGY